jgi:hypothetical protein
MSLSCLVRGFCRSVLRFGVTRRENPRSAPSSRTEACCVVRMRGWLMDSPQGLTDAPRVPRQVACRPRALTSSAEIIVECLRSESGPPKLHVFKCRAVIVVLIVIGVVMVQSDLSILSHVSGVAVKPIQILPLGENLKKVLSCANWSSFDFDDFPKSSPETLAHGIDGPSRDPKSFLHCSIRCSPNHTDTLYACPQLYGSKRYLTAYYRKLHLSVKPVPRVSPDAGC